MRRTLTEVMVVMLAVVMVVQGAEKEDLPLTVEDLQRLGEFLGELTHSLYANTAALCIMDDQEVNTSVSNYWLIASQLSRAFVYVVPCDHPTTRSRPCIPPKDAAPSTTCHKSAKVDIHVTDSKQMEEVMEKVKERYRRSEGGVAQVILGRQVTSPLQTGIGVMSWILASYIKEELVIDVQEIFSFREPGSSIVKQPLGRWNPGGPLKLTHQPRTGPKNFNGNTIVVTSFPYPPYFMLGENCKKRNHSDPHPEHINMKCASYRPSHQLNTNIYVGYFVDILAALSLKLNFTYRMVIPSDPNDYIFGTGKSDNFSGLVGMVARREVDIALASLSISQDRLDVIDLSTNVDYYVRNLYIRANASQSSIGWGTYVRVFTTSTWLGTVGVLLITTLAMWILSRKEEQVPKDIISYRDIIFLFFSCLVQQGVPTTPVSVRGRAVFWLFWVTCVVLYAYYTARLTSYLAVSTVSPPFDTFPGAIEKYPQWQIGIMRGTPLRTFIRDAKSTIYRQFSARLDENPYLMVDTEEEGVRRLLSENYAFFTDTPLMQYVFMRSCTIREIPVALFANFGRLGYMKNLPYAGALDMELTRMDDGGILDRLKRRWSENTASCEEPSPFTELDFTHTVTAFIILLLGTISALLFLLFEKLHIRVKPPNKISEREVREWKAGEDTYKRGLKRRRPSWEDLPPPYVGFVDKQRDYNLSY